MKPTVLVVILAGEILGILGIIVYDGTKEPLKNQSSRRFGLQHAEPSQISQQHASPLDGTINGFSSVVVHRPTNGQQSEDHSGGGGGLTVQDPPKGWPLSEMHVSFNIHDSGKEITSSSVHKEQIQGERRQHPNQLQQPSGKPLQEHLLHKQHLHPTSSHPDQPRYPQENHYQLQPHHQETQQHKVYQQQFQKQRNLHHETTEVEIHPQVIIKLPEQQVRSQQEARLLRPLYVQDPSFTQQRPSSIQEKPFHPSVQITDNVNNEAMLTPVEYHGDGFSSLPQNIHAGTPRAPDSEVQIPHHKAKKTSLTPGTNEEKHLRQSIKATRIRHPHTTLGASYSVGFTTPADAFKNSNQLQNLIIKEHVETKTPFRHGKTLHKQKTSNGELNAEAAIHNKHTPILQSPPNNVSPELLRNENYALTDSGRHHLLASSDGFAPTVHLPVPATSGTQVSSIRLHQSSAGHSLPPQFNLEELRQLSVGGSHYQKLLSRDLVPPPLRAHLHPEGKHGTSFPLTLVPSRVIHSNFSPNPTLIPNNIVHFVSGGPTSNAFSEANIHPSNVHYIPEAGAALPSTLPPHYNTASAHDSGSEKGGQGSATTGKGVTSSVPTTQYHGLRHPVNYGGSSEFHQFPKSVPFYATTQGHASHSPPKFQIDQHPQQVADVTKPGNVHTRVAASTQGVKSLTVQDSSSHNIPSNHGQLTPQKNVDNNVFAGFKNGQFQGGYAGNIGYSLPAQDIRGPFTHLQQSYLGGNFGNGGGQNVLLQFSKDVPQNIPAYLNVNSGALHVGHPTGPFLYPHQSLAQLQGGRVQTIYLPVAGTPHGVYANNILGTGAQPAGSPTVVANVQPSTHIPSNQGHSSATPATQGVYGGAPLPYFGVPLLNSVPQSNAETHGHLLYPGQASAFPGIGGAYPQSAEVPFYGGGGTTFVLSQGALQDYAQQGHLQQPLSQGTPQQHSSVTATQTQNVKLPANVNINTYGTKLVQQQQSQNSQHGTKSSSRPHQQSSNNY